MKHKILFVEDQEDLGSLVKQYLEAMNFEVYWCLNGKDAFKTFQKKKQLIDISIIDIQLPAMNGFELAELIIKEDSSVPFIFLTARNEKKDRIKGLQLGADDYISKPFDIDELVLRIKNIIKRKHPPEHEEEQAQNDLAIGDIILHKDLLRLSIKAGKPITLTMREAELLQYLCDHPNKVLRREDILVQLWGENDYFLGRSLDVFISRLRKLLQQSDKVSIDNIYGVGFVFNVAKPGATAASK